MDVMSWKIGFGVVAAAALMVGCGGPKADKIEVVAFKGGYGIDFYEQAAKEFQEKNPGLNISVSGNARIWEELQPRLVAGDAPDLMFPGWGMDHWALAEEGQLMLLNKALDSAAYGGSGTWRDTFEPSILKLGEKDGMQYVLPYYFSLWGWWYDPGVFQKNGWTPPKTYPELLALCAKIKAKGIAPITFQGQYPYYMLQGMVLPWTQSIGGVKAVDDIQNLTPGAWKSPAVLQAVKMIAELRDKGYFQDGAVGLDHTTSQTNFLQGKAAMIPCGTWLESEMKSVTPPGAQMRYMLTPLVPGGKGDPTAAVIEIEPWMIPAKAKHPEVAINLFKYMTSLPKAKQFVEQKSTLMAIKGSDQANLPETLKEPSRVFKGSKTVWSYLARQWYPEMEKEVEGALTSMLNKQITPEQFCDRCEAAAEKTRKDESIAKHKLPNWG
jgi:N-acetylglucosamine transport system substrate-binding protein